MKYLQDHTSATLNAPEHSKPSKQIRNGDKGDVARDIGRDLSGRTCFGFVSRTVDEYFSPERFSRREKNTGNVTYRLRQWSHENRD